MSPLLWRSRAHLFLHPFLLPPIPSCTSHRFTTTYRYHHRGYSPTPYVHRTPKPRTLTTTEPSYTLIPGARRRTKYTRDTSRRGCHVGISRPRTLTPQRRRLISPRHFLCTKKLFISLALQDEPPVQLHQKLPPRKTRSSILTPSKRTIGTTRNDAQITTLSGNPPTAWPGSRRTGSYRSRHGPWREPWP